MIVNDTLITEAMLDAARDWSYKEYGKPIGNDAAMGCFCAMWAAYRPVPREEELREVAMAILGTYKVKADWNLRKQQAKAAVACLIRLGWTRPT